MGGSWHRALDLVAGGWTLSGVLLAQTGQHLTPYLTGHCPSGTNCYGQERLDLVPGQDPNSGDRTPTSWINTGAFTNANFLNAAGRPVFLGRFGSAGKGIVDGPGDLRYRHFPAPVGQNGRKGGRTTIFTLHLG